MWFSIIYILISLLSLNILLILRKFDLVIINHPLSALYTFFIPRRKKITIFHSPWCFEYKYRKKIEPPKLTAIAPDKKTKDLGFYTRFFIEQQIYRNTKHIVVLSNYMKRICEKLFKTPATIYVLPPFIDITEFNITSEKKSLRQKLNIPEDKIAFFTARSLIPRTGIDILIKSFYSIKNKIDNCLVLIAGTGDFLSYYKNLVANYQLQNYISFLGFVERKTLIEYFYAADCFLLPSWKLEGFGLVLLEALYSNLPIIATPTGAIPENLKNIPNCFISKSKNYESFAQEILNFLKNFNNLGKIDLRKYYLNNFHNPDTLIEKIFAICNLTQNSSRSS